jgi:hypothetical protein
MTIAELMDILVGLPPKHEVFIDIGEDQQAFTTDQVIFDIGEVYEFGDSLVLEVDYEDK